MALGRSEEIVPDRKPQRHAMTALLSDYGIPELESELRRRALHKAELARQAGLHPATITHAIAGRPLTFKTCTAILGVLRRTPVLETVEGSA